VIRFIVIRKATKSLSLCEIFHKRRKHSTLWHTISSNYG